MRLRVSGAKKALIVLATAGVLVVTTGVATVLAVHDNNFQLDGDVLASTTTNAGGHTENLDWDSLFDANGAPKAFPTGFTADGFKKDFTQASNGSFTTNDTSTYATGSKDILPISGWQCNFDNNVNSKVDVMNAYAGAYTDPTSGDQIMYFALERNVNTGDANVGFWFLQDAVGCSTTGSAVTFSGGHHDGDILIVSAFTNGGSVSTIDAYRWNGDDATGSLGAASIAHGADCRAGGQPTNDPICAAANTAAISTPWLTAAGKTVGHSLPTSQFFEGGINLTDTNLAGHCFNTFIGDTRSSQSLSATLFDYAGGTIGECTSTTSTRAKAGDGTTNLTTAPIPATGTLSVKDTATVTVNGAPSFTGNVKFYLCGPSQAATPISSCTVADGVQIGAQKNLTTSGTVTSDAATLTSVGSYCWHAVFSGDSTLGVPGSEDNGTNECFTVTPLQPTLVTTAITGTVEFGQKISDTAVLNGTANKPGTAGIGPGGTINTTRGGSATGNISLTAFGPDSCTTVAFGPVTIAASGDGSYGGAGSAFEFTPASPGQYVFVASYAGDSPNTLGVAATACSGQPAAEKVTVQQIPTTISTTPSYFPQDSATVTSSVVGNNLPANGSVTFSLYGAAGGNTALANCQTGGSTGLVFGPDAHSTGVAAHSATVGTNNTTVRVSASGTFYWLVTYAPGDTAHTGSQSSCVENIAATLTGDAGPGTLFP